MATSLVRRSLVLGVGATLVVGLGVGGFPSAVAAKTTGPPQSISFYPGPQTMHSSTHKNLQIALFANVVNLTSSHYASTDVTVTRIGAPEVHTWVFNLTTSSLKFSPATGKGSLKTGTQLKPFAAITLKLTAMGTKETTRCKGSRTVTQPVKVRGEFSFDTHSKGKHRWGMVGGTSKRTFAGDSVVVYQLGTFEQCHQPPPACVTQVSWSASKQSSQTNQMSVSGTIQKVGGVMVKTIVATRDTSLAKPAQSVRVDSLQLPDSHMSFVVSGGLASVHIGHSGAVTGSARLVSTIAGSSFPGKCGKKKTQHTKSWVAHYKNGTTPLTVHEQIEGIFRLPNLTGSIDRQTVS
jgi:hypothetical protein